MRYIANDNGYLLQVSFGAAIMCNGKGCTEYTGAVPAGHSSLIDWFEEEGEHLYRWKVEDGQLVEDPDAPDPEQADFSLFVKLWENPNPSKAYTGGRIIFDRDLSEFDFLLVEVGFSVQYSERRTTCMIPIYESGNYSYITVVSPLNNSVGGRKVHSITSNSLTLDSANYKAETNNDYCIPQVIYGVRKTVAGGSVIVEGGTSPGGGTAEGAVSYQYAQSLTQTQQATARANIGAASVDDVVITDAELTTLAGLIK